MSITTIKGILVIEHDRGVIYFHATDESFIGENMVATPLRIERLPTPIPEIKGRMLDISHMHGCDWDGIVR